MVLWGEESNYTGSPKLMAIRRYAGVGGNYIGSHLSFDFLQTERFLGEEKGKV